MFYKGRSCAVCNTQFTENDDIVACPVCGAAHHRDCWSKDNTCGFADKHGTPEQYNIHDELPHQQDNSEEDENKNEYTELCLNCGKANPANIPYCTQCGQALFQNNANPNQSNKHMPFYTVYARLFDPLGGVPADAKIDGVPVTDIATFIGPNSHYYIPRFYSIQKGNNGGFNLAAFLLTPYWMLFRRMIGYSLIFIFYIALQLLVLLLKPELTILENTELFSPAGLFYLVSFAVSILTGLFANRIYMKYVTSKIKSLRNQTENEISYQIALQNSGGTRINNAFLLFGIFLALFVIL